MQLKIKLNQLEEIEGIASEYPYILHRTNLAETKVPWHWHEELEFCYIRRGSVKLTTTNENYIFHAGEAYFINTNILCTMERVDSTEDTFMDSHLFHSVFLSGHFRSIFETKYMEPVLKNKKLEILAIRGENSNQKEILSRLKKAAALQNSSNTEFQTRNLFSEIWLLLLEEAKHTEKNSVPVKSMNQERIQTMLSFIQQNYSEKISLEDIASSAAISKRECLRCFQQSIHQTPFEYLLDYRIEIAEKLLKTTNNSIIEIAMQAGFSSEAYFCKIFKKINSMTPGSYRKKYQLSSFIA